MSKKVIDRNVSLEEGTVSFEVLESGEKLVCNVKELYEKAWSSMSDVGKRLVLHAVNAKVGDSAAAPDSDRFQAMSGTWANLLEGTWATRGEGGAGRTTQLEEATMHVTGKDLDTVRAYLEGLSKEDKKDFEKHPQIVEAKASIKAEKAAAARKNAAKAVKSGEFAPINI